MAGSREAPREATVVVTPRQAPVSHAPTLNQGPVLTTHRPPTTPHQAPAGTHWAGLDPALAALLRGFNLGDKVPTAMGAAGVGVLADLGDRQRRNLALDKLTQLSGADRAEAKRFLLAAKEATEGGERPAMADSGGDCASTRVNAGIVGAHGSSEELSPAAPARITSPEAHIASTAHSAAAQSADRVPTTPLALTRAELEFDRDHPLSEAGGQKTVYTGTVRGHQHTLGTVAIGVFKASGSPDAAFLAELKVLQQLRHPNVLPLLGYCQDGWILVTPLMPRDLFTALHCEGSGERALTGAARLRIMREVRLRPHLTNL